MIRMRKKISNITSLVICVLSTASVMASTYSAVEESYFINNIPSTPLSINNKADAFGYDVSSNSFYITDNFQSSTTLERTYAITMYGVDNRSRLVKADEGTGTSATKSIKYCSLETTSSCTTNSATTIFTGKSTQQTGGKRQWTMSSINSNFRTALKSKFSKYRLTLEDLTYENYATTPHTKGSMLSKTLYADYTNHARGFYYVYLRDTTTLSYSNWISTSTVKDNKSFLMSDKNSTYIFDFALKAADTISSVIVQYRRNSFDASGNRQEGSWQNISTKTNAETTQNIYKDTITVKPNQYISQGDSSVDFRVKHVTKIIQFPSGKSINDTVLTPLNTIVPSYTVNIKAATLNSTVVGKIDKPVTNAKATPGSKESYYATPNTGYIFECWGYEKEAGSENYTCIETNQRIEVKVTRDTTIYAVFKKKGLTNQFYISEAQLEKEGHNESTKFTDNTKKSADFVRHSKDQINLYQSLLGDRYIYQSLYYKNTKDSPLLLLDSITANPTTSNMTVATKNSIGSYSKKTDLYAFSKVYKIPDEQDSTILTLCANRYEEKDVASTKIESECDAIVIHWYNKVKFIKKTIFKDEVIDSAYVPYNGSISTPDSALLGIPEPNDDSVVTFFWSNSTLKDSITGGTISKITDSISYELNKNVSYAVKYLDFDSTLLSSEFILANNIRQYATIPDHNGDTTNFKFYDWGNCRYVITKPSTCVAEYSYRVTFINEKTSDTTITFVQKGTNANYEKNVNVEGFKFIGWDKDISSINDTVTTYAQYRKESSASSSSSQGNSSIASSSSKKEESKPVSSSSKNTAKSSSSKGQSSSSSKLQSSSSQKKDSFITPKAMKFSVNVQGHEIRILGAPLGSTVMAFDLQGSSILTNIIQHPTETIAIGRTGMYIIRIGNQVQKVQIR